MGMLAGVTMPDGDGVVTAGVAIRAGEEAVAVGAAGDDITPVSTRKPHLLQNLAAEASKRWPHSEQKAGMPCT